MFQAISMNKKTQPSKIVKKALSQEVSLTDYALLMNPMLNKGTAFTNKERRDFKLFGLLPPEESNISQQRVRSYETFLNKKTNLEKYLYLRDLQDSNETLYYSLLREHLTEMLPIVYTPVVGEACEAFSHIYRRPRGLYIAYPYKNIIDEILSNPRFDSVKVIVVSDGERILGLGDQGAGGMGIPIGKLALYCACTGLHPSSTLPILLDTGTNNSNLLDDPLYIGWRHKRVRGQEYDDFMDAFILAVKKRFPHFVLQWEDFALNNATRLLKKYRNDLCTFNDDIQGTATIATGALLSAIHITNTPLRQQRILIVGAGSAGCGIAKLVKQTMMQEGATKDEALAQISLVDRDGLLMEDMVHLLPFQQTFVKSKAAIKHWQIDHSKAPSLQEVVTNWQPTAILGVTGQAGLFNQTLITEMAKHVSRPIILPLSNPITHSEAIPDDLMAWTDNRAIIGTGSPFKNIIKNGKPFRVDQTNNVYIFPGIGLALIAVKARKVSDQMFMIAAQTLASCSPALHDKDANLLPPLTDIRETSLRIAFAVAKAAVDSGLADYLSDEDIKLRIEEELWTPDYLPYVFKP